MKRRFLRLAVLVLTMVTVLIAFGITGQLSVPLALHLRRPRSLTRRSRAILQIQASGFLECTADKISFYRNLKFGLRCSAALAVAGVLRSLSYKFHYDIIDIT